MLEEEALDDDLDDDKDEDAEAILHGAHHRAGVGYSSCGSFPSAMCLSTAARVRPSVPHQIRYAAAFLPMGGIPFPSYRPSSKRGCCRKKAFQVTTFSKSRCGSA
jgi:hypothetical protein